MTSPIPLFTEKYPNVAVLTCVAPFMKPKENEISLWMKNRKSYKMARVFGNMPQATFFSRTENGVINEYKLPVKEQSTVTLDVEYPVSTYEIAPRYINNYYITDDLKRFNVYKENVPLERVIANDSGYIDIPYRKFVPRPL